MPHQRQLDHQKMIFRNSVFILLYQKIHCFIFSFYLNQQFFFFIINQASNGDWLTNVRLISYCWIIFIYCTAHFFYSFIYSFLSLFLFAAFLHLHEFQELTTYKNGIRLSNSNLTRYWDKEGIFTNTITTRKGFRLNSQTSEPYSMIPGFPFKAVNQIMFSGLKYFFKKG